MSAHLEHAVARAAAAGRKVLLPEDYAGAPPREAPAPYVPTSGRYVCTRCRHGTDQPLIAGLCRPCAYPANPEEVGDVVLPPAHAARARAWREEQARLAAERTEAHRRAMAERAAAWPLERIRAVQAEVADEYRGDEALPKPGVWWPDCSRDECAVLGYCAHPDGAPYDALRMSWRSWSSSSTPQSTARRLKLLRRPTTRSRSPRTRSGRTRRRTGPTSSLHRSPRSRTSTRRRCSGGPHRRCASAWTRSASTPATSLARA